MMWADPSEQPTSSRQIGETGRANSKSQPHHLYLLRISRRKRAALPRVTRAVDSGLAPLPNKHPNSKHANPAEGGPAV